MFGKPTLLNIYGPQQIIPDDFGDPLTFCPEQVFAQNYL